MRLTAPTSASTRSGRREPDPRGSSGSSDMAARAHRCDLRFLRLIERRAGDATHRAISPTTPDDERATALRRQHLAHRTAREAARDVHRHDERRTFARGRARCSRSRGLDARGRERGGEPLVRSLDEQSSSPITMRSNGLRRSTLPGSVRKMLAAISPPTIAFRGTPSSRAARRRRRR